MSALLCILFKIGNYVVRAVIDTGAEMSVISEELAKTLNLTSFIDTRYQGELRGVGSSQVRGLIKNLDCSIYDGIELLESTPLPIQVT